MQSLGTWNTREYITAANEDQVTDFEAFKNKKYTAVSKPGRYSAESLLREFQVSELN